MAFGKTHDLRDVTEEMAGWQVGVGGWIEDLRDMGKMTFLTLRDSTGIAQIVIKRDLNDMTRDLTRQSIVVVHGTVQETRAKDYSFEILADEICVFTRAVHPLPIDPTGRLPSGMDSRLNARSLDMRNPHVAAIFKLRHRVLESLRRTLSKQGFIEITTPKIIGSASEGGANLFSLEYFGKMAYLAQSPQLYKEQMTVGLERVFEIASFYRAEKSRTGRHLTEFTSVDVEAAFMDYTDVMGVLEDLVVTVYRDVLVDRSEVPDAVGPERVPPTPFERVTYSQAIDELRELGQEVEHGDDLLDSHLRLLGASHEGFYFLIDWPQKLKPFYIMEKDGDPTVSRSFDLQFGYLELSSGGTRLHDPEAIKSRLRDQGLDPTQFSDHLQSFNWGMPPHSGWGLGLDRLMTVLAGVDNVREVVLYPRDPDRLSP